jgi:MFS family permease
MLTNYVLGKPINGKSTHQDAIVILLTAIPYAAAAVFQVLYSWHSQRSGEKRWHVVGLWLSGAVFMFCLPSAMQHSPAAGFAVFIMATMAVYGAFSVSNSYIMQLLGGERGMGGAIMNSIGNLGGFVGPYVIGALKDSTGSYFPAM